VDKDSETMFAYFSPSFFHESVRPWMGAFVASPKIKPPLIPLRIPVIAFVSLVVLTVSHAQTSTEATRSQDVNKDEPVRLAAFEIKSDKDAAFVGKSSLSSTRIAVDLSEIPQSVKVLNSSFLKAVSPLNLSDVLNYVGGAQNGGLFVSPGRVNIRGFAGDGDYIDGFAPPASINPESALFDRFEVIKGPSTIFLAADGSPGGVVNKITKSPVSVPSTTVSSQVGRFDANSVNIDSTGPVFSSSRLLYRVVLAQQYADGFYDNWYVHRLSVMPALSYQFNEQTKLEIKGLVVQGLSGAYQGLPIDPRTYKAFAVPDSRNQCEDAPDNWRHDRQKRLWFNFTSRLSDLLAVRVGGMTASSRNDRVVSVAATWNEAGLRWVVPNYNGTQLIPRTTSADDQRSNYRNLQADLNFNFKTGPMKHNLLVGGEVRSSPAFTETFTGSSSAWNPFVKTTPIVTVNYGTISANRSSHETSSRIFALETLKLFQESLILSIGASRVKNTADVFDARTGVFTTAPYSSYTNLKQWGVVYKVLPQVSLFTGYNENFAVNGVGILNGASGVLPPKQGKQYEVGLKGDFLQKRLSMSVSYFDIVQSNNTVPAFPSDPANPRVLIPGVISRGFDGDLSFQVSRNFYAIASFSLYDAKSVLGPAAANFVQPYYGSIVKGSIPVQNTAEQASSVFGIYTFNEGKFKGLSVGVGGTYQSKKAITDGANQVMWGYLPGRTLINANINYRLSKHWKYGMNIDNLVDVKYMYSVRSQNVIIPGTPINIKFSVTYSL